MNRPDPRGIMRTVVSATWSPTGSRINLDCGHVAKSAPHFSAPKPGSWNRCFICGQEALKKWKEDQQK